MNRRFTLNILVLLFSSVVLSGGTTNSPNILFILMEDMGIQIPAYGDNTVATPQLDRLASEGVVFERAQVTAATCAASRGSQYTGLYPHQNGIMGFINHHGFRFREGVPTYVQILRQAGYKCGLSYKTGIMPESAVPYHFMAGSNDNRLTGKNGPAIVNNALDNFRYFLQNLENDRPFYFQAQTPDTHAKWDRPRAINAGSPGWPYPEVDLNKIQPLQSFGNGFVMTDKLRQLMGTYYESIQRVDWFVGQLMAILEEFGHTENTLVIFSSDHGLSEIQRGKTTPYEDGLRVPFIAKWPGVIEPGTRSEAMVSFVDLSPTFQEVAELEPPSYLPGYSLLPVFKGNPSKRKFLYSAYVAHTTGKGLYWPNRTISDKRFKLIHNLNGDGETPRPAKAHFKVREAVEKHDPDSIVRLVFDRSNAPPEFELYDLKKDPGELNNLIGIPKYKNIESSLRTLLWSWRKEVVVDPFCDPEYLAEFNSDYAKAIKTMEARIKELNGQKPSRTGWHIDWTKYTHPWDPSPYYLKD